MAMVSRYAGITKQTKQGCPMGGLVRVPCQTGNTHGLVVPVQDTSGGLVEVEVGTGGGG